MIWFRPELRVLFVCTANVCRSPLAEGLLRHRLRAMGLAGRVQVRSAGVAASRGQRPDPRMREMAAEAGVSLGRIRSRMLTAGMVRRSDHVLVMERGHLDSVKRLCAALPVAGSSCPDTPDTPDNVQLLGRFLPLTGGVVEEIPDPYFGDLQSFEAVYERIDSALTGLIACIESQL